MNINLTLFAQSIAFFVFAWICWRFIWPAVVGAMDERRARIEQGLADADAAKQSLAESKASAGKELEQARAKSDEIVRHAREAASTIEQEGREQGRKEAERVLAEGQQEVERLAQDSRQELREQVAGLVFEGVEKIVAKTVDKQTHKKLVDDLIQRL